jgi:hypothetical protein
VSLVGSIFYGGACEKTIESVEETLKSITEEDTKDPRAQRRSKGQTGTAWRKSQSKEDAVNGFGGCCAEGLLYYRDGRRPG